MKKYLLLIICSFFTSNILMAEEVEMANALRASGKIYAVIGVLVLILVGLFIYLVTLDKKVKKIEKEILDK